MVSESDSCSRGRGFDSRPLHCPATTLGKLFTPVCPCSGGALNSTQSNPILCSASSIIWCLARAFMLTRLYVAAYDMGPMNKGSIAVAVLQR